MKIADFFGFNLDRRLFVLDDYLKLGNLGQAVEQRPAVRRAIEQAGDPQHGYVRLVRRREALRLLGLLLRGELLPWNKYYYLKEVNTATEEDRRYGAEESFLAFCLVLATGQSWPALQEQHVQPGVRALRQMEPAERDAAIWELFYEHAGEMERAYRQRLGLRQEDAGLRSWWRRLKNRLARRAGR